MTAPVTATRPNGKPYRRRRPPAALAIEWGYDGDAETVVLVVRTLDVEEAVPLARAAWRYDGQPADEFPTDCHVEWLRLVPWDAIGSGADSTYLSVDGDSAGSWPALRFGRHP